MPGDSDIEELPDIDDDLAEYGDLDAVLRQAEDDADRQLAEEKAEDLTFSSLYAPVRALFCADTQLLTSLTECKTHLARIQLLTSLQPVQNMLMRLQPRPPGGEPLPKPPANQSRPELWRPAPALAHPPSKKYPHLSKAVEVRCSATEGRHLVARQKILPGEVILVDRPYATSLFSTFYASHCLLCFKRLPEVPVSCPTCRKVNFCSDKCLAIGYNQTHRWECGLLDVVDSQDIGRMATLAYRTLARTGYDYLISVYEELDSLEPSYREDDYISVYSQTDNMSARPTGDHLKRGVTALILARCLQLSGWFPAHLAEASADQLEFQKIAALLIRHIQSCSCNAYEINEFVKKGPSMMNAASVELGGAVYPTISLSNHSCAANTSRTNFGTYGCVRASKTIYPNEKVYDNYGHFYHVSPSADRQALLAAQYFFNCACPACKDNWPQYRELAQVPTQFHCPVCKHLLGPTIDKVKKCVKCKKELKGLGKLALQIRKLQTDFRSIMDNLTEENAEENIKIFSTLLTEIEKVCKLPCKEIIECQQVLLQCFAVLGNSFIAKLSPEECQLTLYTGRRQDGEDSSEEGYSEDDDCPDLI